MLDSPHIYKHPEIWEVVKTWIPARTSLSSSCKSDPLKPGRWSDVAFNEGSYHIGRSNIGVIFGDEKYSQSHDFNLNNLFPLGLKDKFSPAFFLEGLLDGLMRTVSLNILHRKGVLKPYIIHLFQGGCLYLIKELSILPATLNLLIRTNPFISILLSLPHKVHPSYPLNTRDLGVLTKSYLEKIFASPGINYGRDYKSKISTIWIFSDIYLTNPAGLLMLINESLLIVTSTTKEKKQNVKRTSSQD